MQTSFSELEYAAKKKQTRRDIFLGELDCITPWAALERSIAPFYLSSGSPGRPPIGLTRMLRMYVAQQCFNLSDEGMEDALYDSQAIRRFVGIDLARDTAPDATTLLKFRHLLERHQLTESLFNAINAHLAEKGLLLREGTIVDATLIAAPPSTKNQTGKRDPEMHQSKKGNQWYFGMKAHIGVDADSGLVHTVIGTAGNVSDISQAQALLHGGETVLFSVSLGSWAMEGLLGQFLPGGIGNQRHMGITGRWQTEQGLQMNLARRIPQQIGTAHDVGEALEGIVDHDCQLIGE